MKKLQLVGTKWLLTGFDFFLICFNEDEGISDYSSPKENFVRTFEIALKESLKAFTLIFKEFIWLASFHSANIDFLSVNRLKLNLKVLKKFIWFKKIKI